MKYFIEKENYFEYLEDIEKIIKSYQKNGYYITREQAKRIWEEYSDSMCANWLCIDKKDNLFSLTKYYADKLFIEVSNE